MTCRTMGDVVVRHHEIPLRSLPRAMSPLRIVQMSDFHFRRWSPLYERIQRYLATLEFDLLTLTGDFSPFPRDWPWVADILRRFVEPIRPPLGRYAVPGNHDDALLSEQFSDGFVRFLRNESVTVHLNGHAMNLAGVDDGWRAVADVPRTLAHCQNDRLAILLCHMPSIIHHLPDGVVELVLGGHTHGGQWRLPWFGSVTVNDRIARAQTRGLHRVGGRWLHVTSGIGTSGPFNLRVNCPPEVAVLTLVSRPPEEGASSTPERLRP